jgi:hypothetical protein
MQEELPRRPGQDLLRSTMLSLREKVDQGLLAAAAEVKAPQNRGLLVGVVAEERVMNLEARLHASELFG